MTDPLDPARTALLVMDYQPGILARVPDADALLARAAEAIATARRAGATVGYVRVALTDADRAAVPAGNRTFAAAAAAGMMADGTPEVAVHPAVAPQPGDIEVRKCRVGAFSTTDLHQQLLDRGIDTLVLAGISTSGVVLSTVRDAADKDYRLLVVEDGCADLVAEAHQVLLRDVFPRQAEVIAFADLEGLLGA